jgi:hypothetical protein
VRTPSVCVFLGVADGKKRSEIDERRGS